MISKLLRSSIVRFLLGGGVTVVCEYVTFYVLYVFAGWPLLVANTLSFVVGLGISFLFNRLFAFKQQEYHHAVHRQAIMYAALAMTNLIMNNLIVAGLRHISVDPRLGKIVAIAIIAAWNFAIYCKLIFTAPKA